MTTPRGKRMTLEFLHPFSLKGLGRWLPPGHYEVVFDEELTEDLLIPRYRRVSTLLCVPREAGRQSSVAMVGVDAEDLKAAHARDRAMAAPR